MKLVFSLIVTLLSLSAHADIYLSPGESIRVGSNRVYCGVEKPRIEYFCTVESTFDGNFTGRGKTQLEAEHNALQACYKGSRHKMHCKEKTLQCESSY